MHQKNECMAIPANCARCKYEAEHIVSSKQTEHTQEVIVEVLPRRMRRNATLHDLYSMHSMRYPWLKVADVSPHNQSNDENVAHYLNSRADAHLKSMPRISKSVGHKQKLANRSLSTVQMA